MQKRVVQTSPSRQTFDLVGNCLLHCPTLHLVPIQNKILVDRRAAEAGTRCSSPALPSLGLKPLVRACYRRGGYQYANAILRHAIFQRTVSCYGDAYP